MFYRQLDNESELRLPHTWQAEAIFAAVDANREHLRPWLPWVDRSASVADTYAFIRESLGRLAQDSTFDAGIWRLGELVGMIGLFHGNTRHRNVEIGYWLAEGAQGKGLVSKACRAMTSYAFGSLGVERVVIRAATGNTSSRAVAERLGFAHEGTLRRNEWLYNRYVDHESYSMLRDEWDMDEADGMGPLAYPLGEGAELRLYMPWHAEEYLAVAAGNRAHIGRWMAWIDRVRTIEDARNSMGALLSDYTERDGIEAGVFQDGALVGTVSLFPVDWAARKSELAYWLAESAQGKGLATRACRALLRFAFGDLRLNRVTIRAAPGNPRSRAVAERLGFVYEATQRHACLVGGRWLDMDVFSQLREEWEGQTR
jgi:ribosomal-protein-serine acetyltransferase